MGGVKASTEGCWDAFHVLFWSFLEALLPDLPPPSRYDCTPLDMTLFHLAG